MGVEELVFTIFIIILGVNHHHHHRCRRQYHHQSCHHRHYHHHHLSSSSCHYHHRLGSCHLILQIKGCIIFRKPHFPVRDDAMLPHHQRNGCRTHAISRLFFFFYTFPRLCSGPFVRATSPFTSKES